MSHQVLSRKYRPQRFADLVGQEHVARILTNAISSDRVGHAYLFVGPRGVGKTTSARIFARALNCSGRSEGQGSGGEGSVEPCGTCASCTDIAAGSDYDVVELDAASNNHVEDVRQLREQVGYAAVRSPYRIWIVDEVHMLSLPAFNAFLKTLEEPPERVKFLFCTTEEHKLPDTFRSRCQRIEFRPIPSDDMAERLIELAEREGVTLAPDVAASIASGALGGMRDGESLLEQLLAAYPAGQIGLEDLDALAGRAPRKLLGTLMASIEAQDAAAALDAVDACLSTGCKPGVLMDQWLDRFRQQLVSAAQDGRPVARLARAIDVLLAKRHHLRAGADGVLVSQVAAVELARLPDARDLDQLVGALRGRAGTPREQAGTPREQAGTPREQGSPREPRAKASAQEPDPAPARRSTPIKPPRAEASPKPEAPPSADAGARSPPAPERSPTPASASPPATGVDLDSVTAGWSSFVRAIAGRDARLAALLHQLLLSDVERGCVHLRMRRELDGARAMLSRREIQIAFSQVARQTFGSPLTCVLDEFEAAPDIGLDGGPDLSGHPTIQMVTEFTRGRLLNVERRDHDSTDDEAERSEPEQHRPEAGRPDADRRELGRADSVRLK